MCQTGVFGESPGTIHERDYDDRTGSSLTIVGLAMTIGQKTDSKSMARKMVDPYQYTQDILKQYGPGGTAYEGGRKLPEPGNPKKVFVSHGHDDKAKTDVKSFLETKGLEPIILADQPNAGRTIFEKFEDYGDVGLPSSFLPPTTWAEPTPALLQTCVRGLARMSSWRWVTLWPSSEEAAFAHSSRMVLRFPPTFQASSPYALRQTKNGRVS